MYNQPSAKTSFGVDLHWPQKEAKVGAKVASGDEAISFLERDPSGRHGVKGGEGDALQNSLQNSQSHKRDHMEICDDRTQESQNSGEEKAESVHPFASKSFRQSSSEDSSRDVSISKSRQNQSSLELVPFERSTQIFTRIFVVRARIILILSETNLRVIAGSVAVAGADVLDHANDDDAEVGAHHVVLHLAEEDHKGQDVHCTYAILHFENDRTL